MSRLIIISNRLPITVDKKGSDLFFHPSAGGLATGLNSLDNSMDRLWIGWPGSNIDNPQEQVNLEEELKQKNLVPVFLTQKEVELYYEGFSNKTIWPHFHYFSQYTTYQEDYWEAYEKTNQKFAEIALQYIRPDDLVWVHDYQLMLLPALIRKAFPKISIGFFLHIPFPSYELFRLLPWREKILNGVLGADQIGFHTFGYMRHFLSAAYRITGHEHNFGKLTFDNRIINVDVFPMGIDYQKYAFPESSVDTTKSSERIQGLLAKKRKLVLSIDRLDYTKGIPHRLRAFEKFIEDYPEYHGKVSLILIVVPSRSNVDQYADLKHEIDTLVGHIDGKYRTFGWSPIQYYYRSFDFADLTALYKAADIALITPLRDGMNLVAKEFIASKETSKRGVLILSEFAGAATELSDALIVNPRDRKGMVKAIVQALDMSPEEQEERLVKMQQRLKKYTVKHWAENFITQQVGLLEIRKTKISNLLIPKKRQQLITDYQKAKNRLIILDYDGTLMEFNDDPSAVHPDKKLLSILSNISRQDKNKLVIISGRDKPTLQKWLGVLNIDLSAEHGAWIKQNDTWQPHTNINRTWKAHIRPVLENMVDRTPRSFIEEKEYSLAWHYRMIDKGLGEKRIREFRDELLYLTANLNLQVLEGNKVLEIKDAGVNKGTATSRWLDLAKWDFILAIGDDHTDEDIFSTIPSEAYSIKVGLDQTVARFHLQGVSHVRELLEHLV